MTPTKRWQKQFMKAISSHDDPSNGARAFVDVDVPSPILRPYDVLVDVRAVAINPVDFKVAVPSPAEESPFIVRWDFAGVVLERGAMPHSVAIGDEVWGAGDITRAGCFAEKVAVDSRFFRRSRELRHSLRQPPSR
jgi:NADPH:quinone reductase-like Zn-dependent oxidoreductase